MSHKQPNRLAKEKSPYLLQHAANPVDWYPWGEEAFDCARREDKPIFLSIGYSTCHWCHVMERESFEDADVAKLLNDTFVSIKVDREERPDIDSNYMAVCQMLTGGGGWPLTVMMTPDKKPFFATTYIPKQSAFGRLGMIELIPRIHQLWLARREEVIGSADKIAGALQSADFGAPGQQPGMEELHAAYSQFARIYDAAHGGFGRAPKFPSPHNFRFLLRYWKRTGKSEALAMVEASLEAMRQGGIFDHVGFGFHRYSTDARWLVPHFEKMLYDQALLAIAYLEAYQATGKQLYADTAREVFDYVERDMTSPEGGFFSAEDADSEGEEGKFYVWTAQEVHEVLGQTEGDLYCRVMNVKEDGNYVEEAARAFKGNNILHLARALSAIAAQLAIDPLELESQLEDARQKLFRARAKRERPSKDDKILTDWNGLMIAALAKGAQVLRDDRYSTAAQRAIDFALNNLTLSDGRLLHRFRAGEAAIPAYLDDYAFLILGLLETYEANFNVRYLRAALRLNDLVNDHFWDVRAGGYFLSADDSENVLVRQKEISDGAIPSGNSVQMSNLLRLARVTGQPAFASRAAELARAFSASVRQSPIACAHLLTAIEFALGPAQDVTIVGPTSAADTKAMLDSIRSPFLPSLTVLYRPTDQPSSEIEAIADFTKYQTQLGAEATAYVCIDQRCELPTTSLADMLRSLGVEQAS